jgi:hypothetical protein
MLGKAFEISRFFETLPHSLSVTAVVCLTAHFITSYTSIKYPHFFVNKKPL